LRDSTRIFLEVSPVDPDEIGHALVARFGVVEAHDLHVWTVGSGFPSLSAYVLVEPAADCHAIRRGSRRCSTSRFGLAQTTLQVEHAGEARLVNIGPLFRRQTLLSRR
jgi:cobalt-zinc-cadmium efflux system protein